MQTYTSEKIFSLEVSRDNGRLKISACERSSADEMTMRHYEYRDICDDEIKKLSAPLFELLNRSSHHGRINRETVRELQTAGHLLYDSLLTARVKEKLSATDAPHLVISIDDHLVQIPWEIMFDGSNFLCRRFNMGRLVSTSQRISEPVIRKVGKPLGMLVIADPRGDLHASYSEGVRLRDSLEQEDDIVEVNLRSHPVDAQYVKGTLRDFDVLHYAGHADYDLNNPSDSGFLLQDGKLKASDIINMIGPKPLPALVFSNACKSGHTEMWRVGEDYETEIYGLANAFLLAGVQHYIGTFWDVQDEPGLHFALDFYRELIGGVMVGEAVRKARMRLIERYGEDTVIWASYMLYGDPTVRYVGRSMQESGNKGSDGRTREYEETEGEMAVRGGVRGMEQVVAFPPKKHSWMYILLIIVVIVTLFLTFSIFRKKEGISHLPDQAGTGRETIEAKDRRIDELVTSLARDYREGNFTKNNGITDEWTTQPLTMVLMDVTSSGETGDDNLKRLAGLLSLALQNEKRVTMVEREILDKLLAELKLSTSDLADPMTSLKIGKVLSARVMITGSIIPENRGPVVVLRLIDTETTAVRKVISAESTSREIDMDTVNKLGDQILEWVLADVPLQGMITSVTGARCQVNLGQMHGLKNGDVLEVLSDMSRGPNMNAVTGEIHIDEVGKDRSWAAVRGSVGKVKEGAKVRQKRGNI